MASPKLLAFILIFCPDLISKLPNLGLGSIRTLQSVVSRSYSRVHTGDFIPGLDSLFKVRTLSSKKMWRPGGDLGWESIHLMGFF